MFPFWQISSGRLLTWFCSPSLWYISIDGSTSRYRFCQISPHRGVLLTRQSDCIDTGLFLCPSSLPSLSFPAASIPICHLRSSLWSEYYCNIDSDISKAKVQVCTIWTDRSEEKDLKIYPNDCIDWHNDLWWRDRLSWGSTLFLFR